MRPKASSTRISLPSERSRSRSACRFSTSAPARMVARRDAGHAQAALQIMSDYMPKVGALGLDMMFRTATIQANLDFTSEADMVKKFSAGSPCSRRDGALRQFAFPRRQAHGRALARSAIWRDTDAARPDAALRLRGRHGVRALCRLCARRADISSVRGFYHDVAGASFRDLLAGRLPQLPGERATVSDWANIFRRSSPRSG